MTTKKIHNYLVISALGTDRSGIVDQLAEAIVDANCNILDSRMTVLGGEFAVLLLVEGAWNNIAKLETNIVSTGKRLDLLVTTKRTQEREALTNVIAYAVDVVSLDHPGIVHQLGRFFSSRKINIEDLSTSSYPAPHTGSAMFSVHMTVLIPGNQQIATLREEFMDFCDQLNLDAVLEPIKP